MPRKRPPKEVWNNIRVKVWKRDGEKCVHCGETLSIIECNIDHILSGKSGNNSLDNLRTLCKKCHTLRLDFRHRGMISAALKKGIIPPNWRELLWDD